MKKIILSFLFTLMASAATAQSYNNAGQNFQPVETVTLTAGQSSASVQFAGTQDKNTNDVMEYNEGSTMAYGGCNSGTATLPGVGGSAAAALNAFPFPPGIFVLLHKNANNSCSVITSTGTPVIDFTSGAGL